MPNSLKDLTRSLDNDFNERLDSPTYTAWQLRQSI